MQLIAVRAAMTHLESDVTILNIIPGSLPCVVSKIFYSQNLIEQVDFQIFALSPGYTEC